MKCGRGLPSYQKLIGSREPLESAALVLKNLLERRRKQIRPSAGWSSHPPGSFILAAGVFFLNWKTISQGPLKMVP